MADPPTHFFKFIPPAFKFDLSIPSTFLTKMNCGRCLKATLRRGCHEWSVEIDDGVFGDGWRRFVRENGVQEFDFIVFKHQGNMVFDFMVFDQSACEKQYPNLFEGMNVEEPVADTHMKGAKNLKKRKRNDYASQIQENFQVKKESGSTIKTETPSTLDNHPYFISTLKPCSFKKSVLHLPVKFSIPNGLKIGGMILRDDEGRSWKVDLNKSHEKSIYIGRGFKAFRVANGLKEGDAFKFELVENEKDKPPVANFSLLNSQPIKSTKNAKFKRKGDLIPCKDDDRPYFMGELKTYAIKQSYLYLPKRFVRSNGLTNKKEMILRNVEDERSWPVELGSYKDRYYSIGQGWKEFRVANGLKEGDRFISELVNNGEKPILNFSFKRKSIKSS